MSTSELLSRRREQLGFYWRALAMLPVGGLWYHLRDEYTNPIFIIQALVVVAFLARFSVGNHNYTAEIFSDGDVGLGSLSPVSVVRRRFNHDAVLYSLHLAALMAMALCVTRATGFRWSLLVLLLSDLYMLGYDRRAWPECLLWWRALRRALSQTAGSTVAVERNWPCRYAPRTWIVNNLCAALALIVVEAVCRMAAVEPVWAVAAVGLIALINSVRDLVLTGLDV